jgi:hypothetical protein
MRTSMNFSDRFQAQGLGASEEKKNKKKLYNTYIVFFFIFFFIFGRT